MTASTRKAGQREAVASMAISRGPGSAPHHPEVKDVLLSLRSLFPEPRFTIEHRAVAVEGDLQILFEVFDRESRSDEPHPHGSGDPDGGWPF